MNTKEPKETRSNSQSSVDWIDREPNGTDIYGNVLLGIVNMKSDESISTRTQRFVSTRPEWKHELMFKAAVKGYDEVIRGLLDAGVPPYHDNDEGLYPLHAACFQGRLSSARILHEAGTPINLRDDKEGGRGTPLMRASVGGRYEVAEFLLENGADPSLKDENVEGNALVFAAQSGKTELMKLLLQHLNEWIVKNLGNDANSSKVKEMKVEETSMAVITAAYNGAVDVVELLLAYGEYPQDTEKQTADQKKTISKALPQAGINGSPVLVEILLGYIKLPTEQGDRSFNKDVLNTLLNIASACLNKDNAELADTILSKLPSTEATDDEDTLSGVVHQSVNKMLVRAAETPSIKIAQLLLDKYAANVNCLDPLHNLTPLYVAAGSGFLDMTTLLLEYEADIHLASGRYANGPTPLFIAIRNKRYAIVESLLSSGGPVEEMDEAISPETKAIWASCTLTYRAPVKLGKGPEGDEDFPYDQMVKENTEFMPLRFPKGMPWIDELQNRRPDEVLKDKRELRPKP